MRCLVVGVLVSACGFPPEPKIPEQVPLVAAPANLTAKPLEAGQWALYRERVGKAEIGTVRFVVLDPARCGTWIAATLAGRGTQRAWRFCIGSDHDIVEATLDGKTTNISSHRDELHELLTRVLPPQFAGRFVSEDVSVPGGYFTGALRLDGATTTWLHPDVPLGAVVQVKAGAREDVLVAYGEDRMTAAEPVPRTARDAARSRPTFYELGYGQGWWSGAPAGEASAVDSLRATFGARVAPALDVLFTGETDDNRRYVASDEMTSTAALLSAGVRWHLLGRETVRGRMGLPFLEATAGLSWLKIGPETGGGIGAMAAVGWEVMRGAGWGLGLRGDYTELEPLAGQTARRHVLDAGILVRLQLP